MMVPSYRVLFYIFIISCYVVSSNGGIVSNAKEQLISTDDNDINSQYSQPHVTKGDVVNIQLYYESLCPDCRNFDAGPFKYAVEQMSKYLNIKTYPYGNAQTYDENGQYKFRCQHGPKECYGNMLHACALDIIKNHTHALLYNSCMMDYSQKNSGSDDIAAERCAESMKIDSEPIKACAKSDKGAKLLKYYGDESKKANFYYVPYILVNGKETEETYFMKEVCAAFVNPPPPCVTNV